MYECENSFRFVKNNSSITAVNLEKLSTSVNFSAEPAWLKTTAISEVTFGNRDVEKFSYLDTGCLEKEGGRFVHKSALIELVLRTSTVKYGLIDLDELGIFVTELGLQNAS